MWPSSAGVEVFDKTPQMTNQWLHELELHELDGLESVAGPTSVGIGVESIGARHASQQSVRPPHFITGSFQLFGQGILL